MEEQGLNIYQKLSKIRKMVEVVKKNKAGYGYTYVTEDELLSKITAGMNKYQLSLIPSITPDSANATPTSYKKIKTTKKGDLYDDIVNEVLVSADMVFIWVNNENPEETVRVPWYLVGQQGDASQSFGSGLTYAMRYFLLKFFNVSTSDDDPDNWRSKQKAAEEQENKLILDEITNNIDKLVRALLEKIPDRKDELKAILSSYTKDGNYFKIKSPEDAAKLLNELQSKFMA